MATACYASGQSPSVASREAAAIHSAPCLKDRERVTRARPQPDKDNTELTAQVSGVSSGAFSPKHRIAPEFINQRGFFFCVVAILFRKCIGWMGLAPFGTRW